MAVVTNRRILVAVAALLALVVAGAWLWRSRQSGIEPGAIDLVDLFPDAEKRTTMATLEDAFAVQTVSIDGDRKVSIFAHPFSRITWTLAVPDGAVLRTSMALRPDSWDGTSDGAVFRIGVSDDAGYRDLHRESVQPQVRAADRRWFTVELDLSAYAGRQVQLIFNTEPGEAGHAVADACVWGAPRIVPGAAR